MLLRIQLERLLSFLSSLHRAVILSDRVPAKAGARESKDLRLLFPWRRRIAAFEIALVALCFGLGGSLACAQKGQHYAVLPQRQARFPLGLPLHASQGKITGTWKPQQSDIDELEANLRQVFDLSRRPRVPDRQIEHPEGYFR